MNNNTIVLKNILIIHFIIIKFVLDFSLGFI